MGGTDTANGVVKGVHTVTVDPLMMMLLGDDSGSGDDDLFKYMMFSGAFGAAK